MQLTKTHPLLATHSHHANRLLFSCHIATWRLLIASDYDISLARLLPLCCNYNCATFAAASVPLSVCLSVSQSVPPPSWNSGFCCSCSCCAALVFWHFKLRYNQLNLYLQLCCVRTRYRYNSAFISSNFKHTSTAQSLCNSFM